MGFFSAEEGRKLQVRQHLDQLEAESEMRHAIDPGEYKMVFSETARQQLELALSMTPEQIEAWAEEQQRQRENDLCSLEEAASNGRMNLLKCSLKMSDTESGSLSVFAAAPKRSDPIRLCILARPMLAHRILSALWEGGHRDEWDTQQRQGCGQYWVRWNAASSDSRHIQFQKAEASLRQWAGVYCPGIKNLPVHWQVPSWPRRIWRRLMAGPIGMTLFLVGCLGIIAVDLLAWPFKWVYRCLRKKAGERQ